MYSREGKFLIRLAVGVVLAAVLLALAVVIWLPLLRPSVSGWVESEGFRPRAQVPPQHWFFLKDGSVVAGVLKSQDGEQAVVTAPWGGEIRIPQGALAGFTTSPLLVPDSDADIREAILSTSPARVGGVTLVRLHAGGVFFGEISGDGSEKLALNNRFLGGVEIPRRWVVSVTEFADRAASGPETASPPAEPSPACVELLPDGGILVADAEGGLVSEFGPDGALLWKYQAVQPCYATRLPGGNTLVCAYGENRVVEVTREGEVVWSQPAAGPVAARRLCTGRTLIAESHESRLIEVGLGGEVGFWKDLGNISDCLRLPDGNTLVVTCEEVCTLAKIDYSGRRLWRVSNLPSRASIVRATGHFIEIANPDRSQCVYIDQMGGIIFETLRRLEYDE